MTDQTVLSRDQNLAAITDALNMAVLVQSIIVLGSRPTGLAHQTGEYDAKMAMGMPSAVIHFRCLQRVQTELTASLGVAVLINPLTGIVLNRVRRKPFLNKIRCPS